MNSPFGFGAPYALSPTHKFWLDYNQSNSICQFTIYQIDTLAIYAGKVTHKSSSFVRKKAKSAYDEHRIIIKKKCEGNQ